MKLILYTVFLLTTLLWKELDLSNLQMFMKELLCHITTKKHLQRQRFGPSQNLMCAHKLTVPFTRFIGESGDRTLCPSCTYTLPHCL